MSLISGFPFSLLAAMRPSHVLVQSRLVEVFFRELFRRAEQETALPVLSSTSQLGWFPYLFIFMIPTALG